MTVNEREAPVAKGAIVVAWSLSALSIGAGLQTGVNADKQSQVEPAKMQVTHQP